ncbi:MAG: GNAT family N-acetyltransferase, partial [Armatimonadota bacterium]
WVVESEYPGFRSEGVPEITDLNVWPDWRRRGIASALLDVVEDRICEVSDRAGIAVGLTCDYGAAQRLYVLRGYVPDGAGAWVGEAAWDPRMPCGPDDAVIHLVKTLNLADR